MKLKQLLILACISFSITAQSQPYTFSVSTGTYTDLVGSTSLNNGWTWDDELMDVAPIGFDFTYFDQVINQIFVNNYFYGALTTNPNKFSGANTIIYPYGVDLIDRGYDINLDEPTMASLSRISYVLEGDVGSRIFKVEWNNAGFYADINENGSSTDFVNLQVWLYEGSNKIQFHYGPNLITQPSLVFDNEDGPSVGLIPEYDLDIDEFTKNYYSLNGDPSSPQMQEITPSEYFFFLDGSIPDGIIYTFEKNPVSTNDLQDHSAALSISPNPAMTSFDISIEESALKIDAPLTIYNSLGMVIQPINYDGTSIDISALSAGTYYVKITTNKGVITKQLVKE